MVVYSKIGMSELIAEVVYIFPWLGWREGNIGLSKMVHRFGNFQKRVGYGINHETIVYKSFSLDLMRGILNFLDAVQNISEPKFGVALRRHG